MVRFEKVDRGNTGKCKSHNGMGIHNSTSTAAIKHNSHTGAWARLERGELSLEEFYEPFASEVAAMRGVGDKVMQVMEKKVL